MIILDWIKYWKSFHKYTRPWSFVIGLTFTATCYLPPYTPRVRPLDPITFKRSRALYLLGGTLDPRVQNANFFFFTPFYDTRGSFGPGNIQRSLFTRYTGPLDPHRDMTTQKVKVANKNHEKIKYCYYMIYNHM